MKIMILGQVFKRAENKDFDFEHNGINWKFRSRKLAKACDDFSAHIDRIDNDYSGDPAPYFACVYFGGYDANCFDFDDDYVEHDTEILFAKKSYKDVGYDTVIVGDDVDMYELKEEFEWRDLANEWLSLCKVLGRKTMENAGIQTTGNYIFLTKKQIETHNTGAEAFFQKITFLNNA